MLTIRHGLSITYGETGDMVHSNSHDVRDVLHNDVEYIEIDAGSRFQDSRYIFYMFYPIWRATAGSRFMNKFMNVF